MKLIKKLKYQEILFDSNTQILKTVWIGDNSEISDEEIKEAITINANLTKQYKPKFVLADDQNRLFIYQIDIQKWVATTLAMGCIEVGVEKFAIIMPTGLVAKLSTEQTAEESGDIPIEIKYFKNNSDALNWFAI